MKRLKYYMSQMENDTATYQKMYEGITVNPPQTPGNPTDSAIVEYDPKYWSGDVSFEISATNKLKKDRPTLTLRIPAERLGITDSSTAAADCCLRAFLPYIDALNSELYNRSRPDEENGKYFLYHPGGEILERNSVFFSMFPPKDYRNGNGNIIYLLPGEDCGSPRLCLCFRMQVQLPKKKLRKSIQMLCNDLPDAVERFIAEFDHADFENAVRLGEKQAAIRQWLKDSGYLAFLANGSILPRSKGTDLPMENAVPFQSTPEDEIEVCGVRGMGVKKGVTVITGGGYSGKSTLLEAISAGIYDHALGDGRELCITDSGAVTVSAEDGRSIMHCNISPFIGWLPGGDTADFSTDRASGSTSQAANIMEAVDFGAKLLLIDEDRSATNFMIRDRRMKELIRNEPIVPFTDRVNELFREKGVSTILVIGGSGEYLSVADKVYLMEDFRIHDVTGKAKEICLEEGSKGDTVTTAKQATAVENVTMAEKATTVENVTMAEKNTTAEEATTAKSVPTANFIRRADWEQHRILHSDGFSSYPEGSGSEKLLVSDLGFICIGDERIDIRGLHNIITGGQLDALGYMLRYLEISNRDQIIDLKRRIDELYEKIEQEGLDCVFSGYFTATGRFLDLPRKQELMMLVSRMRKIHFQKGR